MSYSTATDDSRRLCIATSNIYILDLYSYCVTAVILVFVFSVVALCKLCCPAYFYVLVTVCVLRVFYYSNKEKRTALPIVGR